MRCPGVTSALGVASSSSFAWEWSPAASTLTLQSRRTGQQQRGQPSGDLGCVCDTQRRHSSQGSAFALNCSALAQGGDHNPSPCFKTRKAFAAAPMGLGSKRTSPPLLPGFARLADFASPKAAPNHLSKQTANCRPQSPRHRSGTIHWYRDLGVDDDTIITCLRG